MLVDRDDAAAAIEHRDAARERSENRRFERLALAKRVLVALAGNRVAEDLGDEAEARDAGRARQCVRSTIET